MPTPGQLVEKTRNKNFAEVDEREQKARFLKIADMIRPTEGENNLYGFLDNSYKYVGDHDLQDRYRSGLDAIKISRKFLKYYKEMRSLNNAGCISADAEIRNTSHDEMGGQISFADAKTGLINLGKVIEFFDRSLGSWIDDKSQPGRKATVSKEEAAQIVDDLRAILKEVEEGRVMLKKKPVI